MHDVRKTPAIKTRESAKVLIMLYHIDAERTIGDTEPQRAISAPTCFTVRTRSLPPVPQQGLRLPGGSVDRQVQAFENPEQIS